MLRREECDAPELDLEECLFNHCACLKLWAGPLKPELRRPDPVLRNFGSYRRGSAPPLPLISARAQDGTVGAH